MDAPINMVTDSVVVDPCLLLDSSSTIFVLQDGSVANWSAVEHQVTAHAQLPAPDAQLPAPDAQLPAPDAQLPAPDAQLPAPDAHLPAADAQLPAAHVAQETSSAALEPRRTHSSSKVTCPLCKKAVWSISKHMMTKKAGHNWPKAKAKHAALLLGIQKPKNRKPTTYARKIRTCPVPSCYSRVSRLDVHMKKYHKSSLETQFFYSKLKASSSSRDLLDKSILHTFSAWVQSSDGGCRSTRTATRQREQVARIASLMKVTSYVGVLADEVKLNELLTKMNTSEEWSCSTVKSYSFSLISFADFLNSRKFSTYYAENSANFAESLEAILSKSSCCSKAISRWVKAFTKKGRSATHQRYEAERRNLITDEQLRQCINGPLYKKVQQIENMVAKNAISAKDLDVYHYYVVRDYLILLIFLTNAHRNAVVAELTVEEYQNSRERDGKIIIDVKRHKTADTYGSAYLVLGSRAVRIMRFYYETLRPWMNTAECPNFFLTRTGTKLSTGQVDSAVRSAWLKCGMPKEQKITPNLVRKSTTTRVFMNDPSKSAATATLMMHSDKTAALHYRRVDMEKQAIAGAKIISAVTGSLEEIEDESELNEDMSETGNISHEDDDYQPSSSDEDHALQDLPSSQSISNTEISPGTSQEESHFIPVCNSPDMFEEESETKSSSNKVFSAADDSTILELFSDLITRKKSSITKIIVVDRLEKSNTNLLQNYSKEQLLNKVRYMKKTFKH